MTEPTIPFPGTLASRASGSSHAVRSQSSCRIITPHARCFAGNYERFIAGVIGGVLVGGQAPIDCILNLDGRSIGIEVKTFFHNSRECLNVGPYAILRKVELVKSKFVSRIDTIVVCHNTGQVWYKRGVGSFSQLLMHKVSDIHKLRNLIAENCGRIPGDARPNRQTLYYKALSNKKSFNYLKERAEQDKAGTRVRMLRSRENKLTRSQSLG